MGCDHVSNPHHAAPRVKLFTHSPLDPATRAFLVPHLTESEAGKTLLSLLLLVDVLNRPQWQAEDSLAKVVLPLSIIRAPNNVRIIDYGMSVNGRDLRQ